MAEILDFTKQTYTLGTVKEALDALQYQVDIGKGKEAGLSYSAEGVEVRTPRGIGKFTWKEWTREMEKGRRGE